VGSLSRGKGAANLLASYAALLRAQPAFRLRLVGPAVDAEGKHASLTLQRDFPDRVSVQPRCSREEAMDLLRQSLFVFSPALRYGWGLIGDAWGTGTPVLSRTEHYDLRDGMNCLVAPDAQTFVHHATSLIEDGALFDSVAAGGRETLQTHSLDTVATILWNILQQAPRA
jgi:glycosyltransferase involved in cell wall biosynthesis